MAEEYKNTVSQHETPKVATEEPSTATGEVKDRGLFDFLGKKKEEEVKPQETTTLASELGHKAQISEPTSVDEEALEHKHTLLEELHEKTEVDEENKPSVIEKLHRSNSSSSSSSDEEDEEKKKKKTEKKNKIVEGEEEKKGVMEKIKEKLPGHEKKPEDHHDVPVVTNMPKPHSVEHHEPEEEKKGVMDKIKEKLPGHSKKPEDSPPLVTSEHPVEHSTEHTVETPAEKKGIIEKIKEKLPGYHAKTSAEEEKKEKESD